MSQKHLTKLVFKFLIESLHETVLYRQSKSVKLMRAFYNQGLNYTSI